MGIVPYFQFFCLAKLQITPFNLIFKFIQFNHPLYLLPLNTQYGIIFILFI